MKKIIKLSNCYFATGLIFCLYSIISHNNQVLNIEDTYYVISANHFALIISLIYLVFGALSLVIEKYLSFGIKAFQYIMFTIPFAYFIFSEDSVYDNTLYNLENPIAFKWHTELIPIGLISSFSISIVLFFSLFVFAFWKWKKKQSSKSHL